MEKKQKWDVFISHASEDQNSFVHPLAESLTKLGAKVWYSEFSLEIGDSISRSIDKGLAESKYGLVIISKSFIGKSWPEYELKGLISKEIGGEKVILPIWHGIPYDEIKKFSPSLADKLALNTRDDSAQDIAFKILKIIRPDIYNKHSRSTLETMADGESIKGLQNEIEKIKSELEKAQNELLNFKCKYCGAPVISKSEVPLDPREKHWDTYEVFECGYKSIGGFLERPCPADTNFPKLKDYELIFKNNPKESVLKWTCNAKPKTKMAQKLSLGYHLGETKEKAKLELIKKYKRISKKWKEK